jgi:hypothetical protein
MKIICLLLFAALVETAAANPLTAIAAVQTAPEPSAPIVTYLKAGTEPAPATQVHSDLPPGWIAVELPGPFDGFVLNRDFNKNLEIKTGSPIYLSPRPDAAILTVAEKGDPVEIVGLFGRWTKIRLKKDLVGYAQVAAAPPVPAAPASYSPPPPVSPEPAAAPAPSAASSAPAGSPSPTPVSDSGSIPLPRILAGHLVSTHHFFSGRPPYDWQIEDESGTRIAYLDISRLLLTDQIDKYVDRQVIVSGSLKPVPNRKDIVLEVESLRLQ